jgi:hypothetical protein
MKYILRLNNSVIYFLLAIAFVANFLSYVYDPLHYISYLCEILIWIFMLPHFFKVNRNTDIFYIVLFYFIFLIIRGIVNGNYYKYILFDIHVYTSIVFLTFFNDKLSVNETSRKIPEFFTKMMIISIPVSFILFILFGSLNIGDALGERSLMADAKSALNQGMFIAPLLIAPFLVPFVREMKPGSRFLALSANALVLVYGIFTSTRGIIAISGIAFLSLINFKISINKKTLFSALFLITALVIFLTFNQKINNEIRVKIDYSIARFKAKNNFTSGRMSEVQGLFEEFSTTELFFGRGAGAEQKFGFWKEHPAPGPHGINFTHFGFLHLILKGGFILLLLVYGLAIYSAVVLFWKGERKYFFVILLYLVIEVSHTQFINYFYVLFLWISISYALRIRTEKKASLKQERVELN